MPSAIRIPVVLGIVIVVLTPVALMLYQSLLSGPFYDVSSTFSLNAFSYLLSDSRFWDAAKNTFVICAGMVLIAVPLGSLLAFVVVRTDIPGKKWLEPVILSPMFISAIVLAFGYVVTIGPVGFVTLWYREHIGTPFWYLYSLETITVLCGLNHVPHVYLYAATALKNIGSDVEEAARVAGASTGRVAVSISLPMIKPAIVYAAVMVVFMGVEQFGFPLVLGEPQGVSVVTTYLYTLAQQFGVPRYQLLAAVAMLIVASTLPLIFFQRHFLKVSERFVSLRGKAAAQRTIGLGWAKWPLFAAILSWILISALFPIGGIIARGFVGSWGIGIDFWQALTLNNFRDIFTIPSLSRGIWNSLFIATIGAAASIGVFTIVALAIHRRPGLLAGLVDYTVLMPRAMPGLVIGLAVFWIFLFTPMLEPFRQTLLAIWIAYSIVWIGYGLRLITGPLLQIGQDLEEAASVAGARARTVIASVTVPLLRPGLAAAWILLYIAFVREYATAVYLFAPGSEVLGSLMITLWSTGGVQHIAALSVINLVMVGAGVLLALRIGRLNGQ